MQSVYTKFKIASLFVLLTQFLSAQQSKDYTQWSVGLGNGFPITFFGVNSAPVGYYMGNARYAFNPKYSLEGRVSSNVFYNSNTGNTLTPGGKITPGLMPSDIRQYRSEMLGLHGIFSYNLTEALGLHKDASNNWAPFVSFGGGLHLYKFQYSAVDGTSGKMDAFGKKPARDYQLGLGTKYYINKNLDINMGIEYHYVESYYLDAAGADRKLDNFLNIHAGIQYKIGSEVWKNAAEWSFKNMDNPYEMKKNYAKWSIDFNTGLPVMFTPSGYDITGMIGLGARHSFSKSFALGLNYNYGKLGGNNNVPTLAANSPIIGELKDVQNFRTTLNQITIRSYFNLRNLRSEPEVKYKWNHYASIGAGYIFTSQDVQYSNGSSRSGKLGTRPIQNIVVGYIAKKYLTPNLDLNAGVDYSRNGSRYLDAAPVAKKYLNHHLYFNVGISYKIGANDVKENQDWAYQGYSNYRQQKDGSEQVPVVMKQDEVKEDTTSRVVDIPSLKDKTKDVDNLENKDLKEKSEVVKKDVKEVANDIVTTKKPKVTPKPITSTEPKTKPKSIILDQPVVAEPNNNNEVTPPPMMYNVIVACYHAGNEKIAINFKKKLEKMGYQPSLYRDNMGSRMIRLSIISTDDRLTAVREMRKARRTIEKYSWIHLYNKQ